MPRNLRNSRDTALAWKLEVGERWKGDPWTHPGACVAQLAACREGHEAQGALLYSVRNAELPGAGRQLLLTALPLGFPPLLHVTASGRCLVNLPSGSSRERGQCSRLNTHLDAAPPLRLQEVHGRHEPGLEREPQEEVQLAGIQLFLHGQDLRGWGCLVPSPPRPFGLGENSVITLFFVVKHTEHKTEHFSPFKHNIQWHLMPSRCCTIATTI